MFRAEEKPKSISDADYAEMYKEILDVYSEGMGKIEAMKKIYWEA